ncbi:hypothetical protein V8F20_005518 [Naviculisporaceae sp. PSN 640]
MRRHATEASEWLTQQGPRPTKAVSREHSPNSTSRMQPCSTPFLGSSSDTNHGSFLLIVAAAAAASAELFPGHQAIKRALVARQTESPEFDIPIPSDLPAAATCLEPLLSLYETMPTPAPELTSLPAGDPCGPFTVPADIAEPYSSYTSAIQSWFGEHSSEIFEALSACPQITSLAGDAIASITGSLCESTGAPSDDEDSTATGSAGPEETGGHHTMDHGSSSGAGTGAGAPTPTGTAGGAAQTSSKSTAGAHAARETGFAGAAIAAGAFLGAVALL